MQFPNVNQAQHKENKEDIMTYEYDQLVMFTYTLLFTGARATRMGCGSFSVVDLFFLVLNPLIMYKIMLQY